MGAKDIIIIVTVFTIITIGPEFRLRLVYLAGDTLFVGNDSALALTQEIRWSS